MVAEQASSSDEIYTSAYYDRIGAVEHSHWWHLGTQRVAKALLFSTGVRRFPSVLDAGCGTGGMMAWAEAELGATELCGVDVSPDAVRACAARSSHWTVSSGSVMELPSGTGQFDLVICNDVIQHLPTNGGDLTALKEIRRVLKPGGLLVLRTNSRLGIQKDPLAQDHDYKRYIRAEVVALVQEAGLEVRRVTYINVIGGAHETVRRLFKRPKSHPNHVKKELHKEGQQNVEHWIDIESTKRQVYEGLSIQDTARGRPIINSALLFMFGIEAHFLHTVGRSLGFGHSIVVVAQAAGVHANE